MNHPFITPLFPKLIEMSTVKLCKIKLSHVTGADRAIAFGHPAMHIRSGIILLPEHSSESILRIDTETDRLLEPVEDYGRVSLIAICQERDLAFAAMGGKKEVRAFRITDEKNYLSMKFDFEPESITFDGDRDLLLVSGHREDSTPAVEFYQFPDGRMLREMKAEGEPLSVTYDDLDDLFMVLYGHPSSLVTLDPKKGLDYFYSRTLGGEEGLTFELCPSGKKVVVGTVSGKIVSIKAEDTGTSVVASFREQVSRVIFNPLVGHLYVSFSGSRHLAVIDMETDKVREVIKCSSEISDMVFDELHNKIYVLLPEASAIEVYLDQGR